MRDKNYIKRRNVKTFIKIFLAFISINLGTLSLFSQSVTLKTPFNFGNIVIYSPYTSTVTLTGTQRTTSGNALLIPSQPGTLSLATFRYTARGNTTVSTVSIDAITITTNMTVNGFVITPSLPISLGNNQTVDFTVTQATLSISGYVAPGAYSSGTYIVRINGTGY